MWMGPFLRKFYRGNFEVDETLSVASMTRFGSACSVLDFVCMGSPPSRSGWRSELFAPQSIFDSITTFKRFVLGCIDADFYNQIVIFQHFSRSTRFSQFCAARISKFCKMSSKISWFWRKFEISQSFDTFLKMLDNFLQKFEFRAVQKCANLVDLEKCWKMTIYLQRSALIQPRTSLGKSDVSWRWVLFEFNSPSGTPSRDSRGRRCPSAPTPSPPAAAASSPRCPGRPASRWSSFSAVSKPIFASK